MPPWASPGTALWKRIPPNATLNGSFKNTGGFMNLLKGLALFLSLSFMLSCQTASKRGIAGFDDDPFKNNKGKWDAPVLNEEYPLPDKYLNNRSPVDDDNKPYLDFEKYGFTDRDF